MLPLILLGLMPATTLGTAALNWLALIPWRRNRHEPWPEQARRLWPVVVAAQSTIWILPLLTIFALALLRPGTSIWALFGTGIAALAGALAGTLPLNREVFPRLGWAELVRQCGIGFCLRLLLWVVLGGAAVAMPERFGWSASALGAAVVALQFFWARSGWLRLGRPLGLFVPAPERLQRIVAGVESRMGIACRGVWVIRLGLCQALALPLSRELAFSDRLLEVMSDEEIAAICAHELGHLTESRGTLLLRLVRGMAFLPWIFIVPFLHTFGALGFYLPLLATLLVPRATAAFVQRLETRADRIAMANEADGGVYARALLRLSEDNLTPVVFPGKSATHPHTYDRVIAAGVTPEFPRPRAPAKMAWHGHLLAGLLGLLLAIFAMQQIG